MPPQRKPHPRRPQAHHSVSLRHSPPTQIQSNPSLIHPPPTLDSPNPPASDKANPPSSVSSKIQSTKNSSGESSDVGKWFENTNNNVLQGNSSFADNEPPFFLRNSSSSETPPEGHALYDQSRGQPSTLPYRPGHLPTEGSSTEDFRSVIDDLTVANKKLKQKLKKYERLYDAHLQDEKLFEVRFHGLPDHKKKDLEATLRKFAAELDDSPSNDYSTITYQPPPFDAHKTTESGYVSMSASGQNSISAPSNQASNQTSIEGSDRPRMTKAQYSRRQQSIHSYLHDIPVGLLPRNPTPMTEKSKKKLVVRRLEQIFAGKRSGPGSHPQPMQQEEVAQSAAMADRRAKEATGQRYHSEGNREARIMPGGPEVDIAAQHAVESRHRFRQLNTAEQDHTGSGSPDQRPTRPLDLDPYRAQVPAENMEYIRHLGFTPPDMATAQSPEDGHGWLYFNLVVNMAQLHTLNVTPAFVKDAVAEYSSKFELSHDGRRIRWRGGHDLTTSSSGGSSSEHLSGKSPLEPGAGSNGVSPNKRLKTAHSASTDSRLDSERKARRVSKAQKEQEQNKLAYKPLFFHEEESDEDDDFYGFEMGSSSNSPFQAQQPGDSSGFGSSAMRSSSSKKKHAEDGPMIFYNKAKFCTDLTGDRRGLSTHNPEAYNTITAQPLGIAPASRLSMRRRSTSDIGEPRGPLDASPMELDTKDGAQISSSEGEIGFSPEALNNDNGTDSTDSVDFEVSGLGGVQPDDNFAIKVRRSQTQSVATTSSLRRKSHLYPQFIQEALKDRQSPGTTASSPKQEQPVIKEEILSASHRSLPSSILPPASFLPFDSTSSGDLDSDMESSSDVSSSPSTTSGSDEDNGPATALQLLNITPHYTQNKTNSREGSSGEDDDADDGSIDLLAAAREADPKSIRASECEHDATFTDRLASEITVGSSAATAGGGSGFNTPMSMDAVDDTERLSRKGGRKRESTTSSGLSYHTNNSKRARTRDS